MIPRKSYFKSIFHVIALASLWILIFFSLPAFCHSHGHHHHHHDHDEAPAFKYSKSANEHFHEPDVKETKPKVTKKVEADWTVWRDALGSTLLISAAPFFILFFVPLDKSKEKRPLLKILLSFASGGLLGDAFLHLIPHALEPHTHSESGHAHSHSHGDGEHHGHDMSVGLSVLLGIMTFLLVEKGVRLIKGGHGHSHSGAKDTAVDKKKDDKDSKKKASSKSDKPEEEGMIILITWVPWGCRIVTKVVEYRFVPRSPASLLVRGLKAVAPAIGQWAHYVAYV